MPIYKHTWNFTSNGGGKWGEVHHGTHLDLNVAILANSEIMRDRRLAVLHPVCTLTSVSVYPVHPPGVGTILPINRVGTADVTIGGDPANQGEAAVISLAGVGGGKRKLWLRGLPERSISRENVSGATVVQPAFRTAVDLLIGSWRAQGFGILRRGKPAAIGSGLPTAKRLLLSVRYTAEGLATFETLLHDYVPGDEVIIGGVNGRFHPRTNGAWRIVATTAPAVGNHTFTIEKQGIVTPAPIPLASGYVFRASYSVAMYDATQLANPKLGTRQTKNESTGSVGARSAEGGRGG